MKKIFLNKRIKNILVILIVALTIFFIFNFIVFYGVVKSTKNKPFASARAYMLSAEKINNLYIFPLSHMTHWEHPITKPFYAIRDKLYYTGLSKFPKNEGEKEIWWYKIRYVEYRELVEDNFVAYQLKKDYAIPKFVYSKVNRFHDWDNELYSHIQPIANAKITDKNFAKFKLDMFVQLSRLYVSMNNLLVQEPSAISKKRTGSGKPLIHWVSDKEVEKYDKIYQTYLSLLEYSRKYEKASYDYFYNDIDRRIWEWFLAHEVSKNIMMSRFYNNKLTCGDFYLKLYSDNQKLMRDSYEKNGKKLSYGIRARMSLNSSTVIPIVACRFHDCPSFKNYSEYVIKDIRKRKPTCTWGSIENSAYSRLEKEKRYDELKRVKKIFDKN